jgi:hypothetical protein
MNITEIDDALSAALNSLAAAQAILRKGASTRDLDVLRKLDDPRVVVDSYDPARRALGIIDDLTLRLDNLEAQRAEELEAATAHKTYTRFDHDSAN